MFVKFPMAARFLLVNWSDDLMSWRGSLLSVHPYVFASVVHYENTPIQTYKKFHLEN